MNFKDFKANAEKLEAVLNLKTIDQIEDAFWQSWNTQDLGIKKLYATDNLGSWFSDNCIMWNLGQLSFNDSLIHGVVQLIIFYTLKIDAIKLAINFYISQ